MQETQSSIHIQQQNQRLGWIDACSNVDSLGGNYHSGGRAICGQSD
jgi:hypothetical protein